jgi:hypothetical protein
VIARATTNNRHQQRTTEEVNMGYSIRTLRMDDIAIPADGLSTFNENLPDAWRYRWHDNAKFGDTPEGVQEELAGIGFMADIVEGGVVVNGWDGDKQPWEWDEILRAIAKAAPSSEAVWIVMGEDGWVWAHVFADGSVSTESVDVIVASGPRAGEKAPK